MDFNIQWPADQPAPVNNTAGDTLYYWAKRYVAGVDHLESSMPGAYADAEVEYCEDEMRRHLGKEMADDDRA